METQNTNCKVIEGFSNYLIYEDGRVWSKYYNKFLKHAQYKNWYPFVTLTSKHKPTHKDIHRLVAEHFIPNPDDLPFVNHIDEDKTNFSIANLEWCNHSTNMIKKTTKRTTQGSTGHVNIRGYDIQSQGKWYSYWEIKITRDKKIVFRKKFNKNIYSLEDAVKVRDDFFRENDYLYYDKLVQLD